MSLLGTLTPPPGKKIDHAGKIALVVARSAEAQVRAMGMQAANERRAAWNESPEYTAEDFAMLANELRAVADSLFFDP